MIHFDLRVFFQMAGKKQQQLIVPSKNECSLGTCNMLEFLGNILLDDLMGVTSF